MDHTASKKEVKFEYRLQFELGLQLVGRWVSYVSFEPRSEKTGVRGFRPGQTQTGMYNHRRRPEARNLGSRKQRDCTIRVAKTKAPISFAVLMTRLI